MRTRDGDGRCCAGGVQLGLLQGKFSGQVGAPMVSPALMRKLGRQQGGVFDGDGRGLKAVVQGLSRINSFARCGDALKPGVADQIGEIR